ncbi:Sec-independent protein translocase subunit TatA [uncultured Aquabacterium sp.]|uniref:Sec-independent protein translocase subunit TatA n=1 Tax=uncultured Aquabacterium sp. TaxID=158753 RepID=UPI002606D374|nr:Sec-independent protein translocase subunit TatA [uncultured Aquabacterium sp.]
MGSFSSWDGFLVVVLVGMVFGTKKLKNVGSDLGAAVKGFKDGMKDGGSPEQPPQQVTGAHRTDANTVDVDAKTKS